MRILITGGAGYIGTELAYFLSVQENIKEITIYDNLSRGNHNLFIGATKFNTDKIRFVEADILDTRKLRKCVNEADVVYHLAAKVTTPFADQNPHLFEQVNHWGTAELTYAIEASNVQKFIYASSLSVYGSSANKIDESAPLNPRTNYGISKMRGEEHVKRISEKIPTWNIRMGNVYGYSKSMRFDAVINKFMFDANFKKKITINGDGSQVRAFLHIDRASGILGSIGMTDKLASGLYNLLDENMPVNDVADLLKEIYPDLEMIYVNQHMKLRHLWVTPDESINHMMDVPLIDMKIALAEFKNAFTF